MSEPTKTTTAASPEVVAKNAESAGSQPSTKGGKKENKEVGEATEKGGLSNKEMKELKKQEKAAKRAAQKAAASGISIETQQKNAELKKEKKQKQKEMEKKKELEKEQKIKARNQGANGNFALTSKSTLFGHLETAAERRASLLAVSSVISSNKHSKITAQGFSLQAINAITSTSNPETVGQPQADSVGVPGTCSIIPDTIVKEISVSSELSQQIKDLIINKDLLHKATLKLTDDFAKYKIVGSTQRCLAMLDVFKTIISDYQTPPGTILSRNLTQYLSHQIDFIRKARPLSVTMGNTIRWLKQQISMLDVDVKEKDAKASLLEDIDMFIQEKIKLADRVIIDSASQHIQDNTTIVTYGCSQVLKDLFVYNKCDLKKNFKVIIVDSRPLHEGRQCADYLKDHGVDVMYCMITSLAYVFQTIDIDYVFMGAHSVLSNGFMYSRVGSAMLAMTAKLKNIPVIICCETLKFTNRVQLDSLTFNELADPNELLPVEMNYNRKEESRNVLLDQFIKERRLALNGKNSAVENSSHKGGNKNNSKDNKNKNQKENLAAARPSLKSKNSTSVLEKWESNPNLNIFNTMYDLTPPEYINKIITECGVLPPSSVPVILREYNK